MKKLLKMFLAVSAIAAFICIFAVSANAATSGTTGSVNWSYSNGTLTISGEGAMADYSTYSSAPWYSYKSSITTVNIGEGVTSVSQYGFYGYSNLISLSLPSTLEKIGALSFTNNTGLTVVTLPEELKTFGYGAFYGCTNLRIVFYDAKDCKTMDGADSYPIFYNCTSLKNIYIGNAVKHIPDYLFAFVKAVTTIELPENVSKIGEASFYGCSALKTVETSYKLYYIGDRAFKNCTSLTNFVLPELVTTIGDEAFYGCTALASLDVSYHVTQIGADAFTGSGVTVNTTTDAFAATYCKLYDIPYNATEASYGDIGSLTPSVEVMVSTNTALSVLNGKLVIYVDFDKTLTNECVHMAFYSADNKVVDYMIVPVIKATESIYTVTNDISSASYAKVFVWDSLETLRPISPIENVDIVRP